MHHIAIEINILIPGRQGRGMATIHLACPHSKVYSRGLTGFTLKHCRYHRK